MEIIKSVQIRKFRSLTSITKGLDLSHLNIFVGQNDQGKSNVLRALNLFFNSETDMGARFRFAEDYCYHSSTGKGARHEIRIDLYISPPEHRFKNAELVHWTKKWKKDGSVVEERKFYQSGKVLNPSENIYKWLDKIRYRYIPAIKGQNYFSSLMGELHDVLNEAHEAVLSSQGEDFISGIREVTESITKELDEQIGISNTIQVPSDFKQLFSNLDFGVRLDGNTYHLKQRGDGIKIRHIPVILKYMSQQEKNISRAGYVKPDTIWGFEEPENNLEMKYAFDLASTFKSYSEDIQILVTSHSPAFYSLDKSNSDGITTFHITQGEDGCTKVSKIDREHTDMLHSEMGLLPLISPYLEEAYKSRLEVEALKNEMKQLKDRTEVVVLTEDTNQDLIRTLCRHNSCDQDVTEFVSYHGRDQLAGGILIARYLQEKDSDLRILIHVDRDYLDDSEVEIIEQKIRRAGCQPYIPNGVDLESEFICPNHINHLYSSISIERADELIAEATKMAAEASIERLVDHELKKGKPNGGGGYYRETKRLEDEYAGNPERFRYGKKVLGQLKSCIQLEIGENPNLVTESPFMVRASLKQFFQ